MAFTKGSDGSSTTYSEGSLGTGVVILPSCMQVCLMTYPETVTSVYLKLLSLRTA